MHIGVAQCAGHRGQVKDGFHALHRTGDCIRIVERAHRHLRPLLPQFSHGVGPADKKPHPFALGEQPLGQMHANESARAGD